MVNFRLLNYLLICATILLLLVLLAVLLAFAYLVGTPTSDQVSFDSASTYECGFNPFEEARLRFNVNFYLVAVLFILFDLEVILLMPWAVSCAYTGLASFGVVCLFLLILTVGFYFEWQTQALEWSE